MVATVAFAQDQPLGNDRSPAGIYAASCASCHGANFQGGQAGSLVDGQWKYGADEASIIANIKVGIPTMGMPAYGQTLSDGEIKSLVSWLKQQKRIEPKKADDSEVVKTKLLSYRIETVTDEVKTPWAIDWLPDGRGLITEKAGRLRILQDGKLLPQAVEGTPKVAVEGQSGLLDVAVDPDYANQPWIYLSYSHALPDDSKRLMTRLVRGQLEGNRWVREQVLFEIKREHYLAGGVHFGCRIVFDKAGLMYFGMGERGRMELAQDLTRPNGKHYRLHRDGSIPADNPFVGREGVYEAIFTYGNRNPQGLAVDPKTGKIWETEHGPMGGDELNLLQAGKNYGWPVITYGINYNGRPISKITEKEGMEQPVVQWTPSPAMCGLDFYNGDRFKAWKGNLLAGALKFEEVKRLVIDDEKVTEEEVILKGRGRVRDVNAGPDGFIYLCLNGPDKVVRLVPVD